jgi:hypothetical protein
MVFMPYNLFIVIFRALKRLFPKRSRSLRVTRYHMARLIGFACSKAAAVGVGLSAFEPTGIFASNSKSAGIFILHF